MGLLTAVGAGAGYYFGGPMGSAVGGIIGGGVDSFLGQNSANSFNADEAQRNREFQEWQTGTAYQRAVVDMKAAGLNPMLAYSQGGASSGSGSMATYPVGAGAASLQAAASGAQAISSASQAQSAAKQADTASRQTDSNVALQLNQANKAYADAGLSNNALLLSNSYLRAVIRAGGAKVINLGDNIVLDAMDNFAKKSKTDPELASAGSLIAERMNTEELHKFLNVPATNQLMKLVQMMMRFYLGSR